LSEQIVGLLLQIPLAGVVVVVVFVFLRHIRESEIRQQAFLIQVLGQHTTAMSELAKEFGTLTSVVHDHNTLTQAIYQQLQASVGGRRTQDTQPYYASEKR
jgi:hypothetical protein